MADAKRKKRTLTVKQAKLVKAKAQGKTHKEAYVEAGYAPTTDNAMMVNANRVLSKPNVQEALQAEMARQGITLEKIIKPVADALEAKKIVTSPTEPDKEVADHSIRLKASSMAQTLLGANKNQEGGGTSIHFHQHIEGQKEKYGF